MCCPWAYGSSLKQLHPHYLAHILGFWVACVVNMMSLCPGWGWLPPPTASCIHIRHMQSVCAHWYAVHGHTAVALNSYTHLTWVSFWGSGSLVPVVLIWWHNVIVEAEGLLKLLPASAWDTYKVLEQIDILSMGIQQQPWIDTHTTLRGSDFGDLGGLWSQNDVIMSWLRLTANSNCFPHPH